MITTGVASTVRDSDIAHATSARSESICLRAHAEDGVCEAGIGTGRGESLECAAQTECHRAVGGRADRWDHARAGPRPVREPYGVEHDRAAHGERAPGREAKDPGFAGILLGRGGKRVPASQPERERCRNTDKLSRARLPWP